MYNIKLQPTIDNKFIIVEDYTYKDITVFSGYKTNGANIPRIVWWLIPPFKPKYLPAVVIHDWLCDQGRYKEADTYFKEMLYIIENSLITKLMVTSVILYHKIRY